MELREFVKKTIVEIVDGVVQAQLAVAASGARVNPKIGGYQRNGQWNTNDAPQDVQFDVALTQSEGTGTEGGIGVFFGAVGLGSKGQSESTKSAVTRVQFSVPLMLPLVEEREE